MQYARKHVPCVSAGASESSEPFLIDSGTSTQHVHPFSAPKISSVPWSLGDVVVDTIFVWTWNLGTENIVEFCSLLSQQVLHEGHSLISSGIYSTKGSNAPETAGSTDPTHVGQSTLITDKHLHFLQPQNRY